MEERLLTGAEARGALVADLEPGDLLYIPPMWLHEARALTPSLSVNVWTQVTEAQIMDQVLQLPLPGPLASPADRAWASHHESVLKRRSLAVPPSRPASQTIRPPSFALPPSPPLCFPV